MKTIILPVNCTAILKVKSEVFEIQIKILLIILFNFWITMELYDT